MKGYIDFLLFRGRIKETGIHPADIFFVLVNWACIILGITVIYGLIF